MVSSLPAALLLALAGPTTSLSAPDCTMALGDRAWLEAALNAWRKAEPEWLMLESGPLPMVAAIDGQCLYLLPEGQFARVNAAPHHGTIVLPDGAEVPLGPVSFASGEGGYFVMSLPSVWQAAGVSSEFGLERMMTGVLLHEMMHIRQTSLAAQTLASAIAEVGIPDDELTDDIVQDRFSDDADYVAAYEAERDALFAAAAAMSHDEARSLASKALELMRARRQRWFADDKAPFIAIDDVFLTMEGMGQLLIFRYFRSSEGGNADAAAAIEGVRRGGRWWTQDEGLALMLVVDRLLPGWQERAFRDPDWRAEQLLAAAVAH